MRDIRKETEDYIESIIDALKNGNKDIIEQLQRLIAKAKPIDDTAENITDYKWCGDD